MKKYVFERVNELLDAIELNRARKLSRGSVRSQRGYLRTRREWKSLKDSQDRRLIDIHQAWVNP